MSRARMRSQMRPSGRWKLLTIAARSPGYRPSAISNQHSAGVVSDVVYRSSCRSKADGRRLIADGSLPDSELGLGLFGSVDAWVPARRPDQVDVHVVDRGEAVGEDGVGLGLDHRAERAGGRGQGHVDDDVLALVVNLNAVDQAE